MVPHCCADIDPLHFLQAGLAFNNTLLCPTWIPDLLEHSSLLDKANYQRPLLPQHTDYSSPDLTTSDHMDYLWNT